jgi:hypothetical protein
VSLHILSKAFLNLPSFKMDPLEYVAYFFFIFVSFYFVYKAFVSVEKENRALKDRNWLLANHLQLAELRTGVPYYSSVASQSVPGELNKHFFRALQSRVQHVEETEEVPTHE